MKFICPCCGYFTIDTRGNFEICPICYWEDDPVQFERPDYVGGANPCSLRQSQQNYIALGACDAAMMRKVRPASESDRCDASWSPFPPNPAPESGG